MLPEVERFASLIGCAGVELSGRKGWMRVMKKYGYVREGDGMVKVFNG